MRAGVEPLTEGPRLSPRPSRTIQLLWFLLPAFASIMLLATTNLMCQEVAVVPFLWVFPLSLYLISFVVCFDHKRWYRRGVFHVLMAISLPIAVLVLVSHSTILIGWQIGILGLVLFGCCMVAHGEMVRLKPDPAFLTRFYLLVSAGGAAGGITVALIAPRIFSGFWEFHLGLVGSVLLTIAALVHDRESWWYWARPYMASVIMLGLALAPYFVSQFSDLEAIPDLMYRFHYYAVLSVLAVFTLFIIFRTRNEHSMFRRFNAAQFASVLVLVALCAVLWKQIQFENLRVIRRDRNFYGVLTVKKGQQLNSYALTHGQILHGYQLRSDPREPNLYYSRRGGIGRLLQSQSTCTQPCSHRYGMIGLGVGTLAAYGRSGDVIRFYEINPQVIAYSQGPAPYFTYLRDSAARISLVPGDARLSLERELHDTGPQNFDVLVIDAFTSDAIPVHLLTEEAIELYLKHLRGPDSILAFHISNRVLALRPVLAALAARNGLAAVALNKPKSRDQGEESEWVLLSRNPRALELSVFQDILSPMPAPDASLLWTDDYSNLFRVLRPE